MNTEKIKEISKKYLKKGADIDSFINEILDAVKEDSNKKPKNYIGSRSDFIREIKPNASRKKSGSFVMDQEKSSIMEKKKRGE